MQSVCNRRTLQLLRNCSNIRSSSTAVAVAATNSKEYIKNVAKATVPNNIDLLYHILQLRDDDELVSDQQSVKNDLNMNPFFIPIARDKKDSSYIGYMRWPTQKIDELQLARTNETGLTLLSTTTDHYIYKLIAEADANITNNPNSDVIIRQIDKFTYSKHTSSNTSSSGSGNDVNYRKGDFQMFIDQFKGKLSMETDADRRINVDRFLSTKRGVYPDSYERLAQHFHKKCSYTSTLITCEKAVGTFYGWGHPISFHANMLCKIVGNEKEASHAARAALRMPVYTVASTKDDLLNTILLAGFTSIQKLAELHAVRATDPREKDISEKGISMEQIQLDQAAHLMDACALGHFSGGYKSIKHELAHKYKVGGYPDIEDFLCK